MELLELNQKKMKQSSIELIEEKIKFQMESAQMDRNNGVDWSMSVVIGTLKKLLTEVEQSRLIHKQEIVEAHESGVGSVEYGYGVEYYEETFKSDKVEGA